MALADAECPFNRDALRLVVAIEEGVRVELFGLYVQLEELSRRSPAPTRTARSPPRLKPLFVSSITFILSFLTEVRGVEEG
jgi:hypothetical protein